MVLFICLVLMMFINKDGRKYATVSSTSSVTDSEAHECKIFFKFRRKSKNQICFPL